jgi:integrase
MLGSQQGHEEPTGGKDISRMARKKEKRPYGSGCLLKIKTGWAIRWREEQDGKRIMKYETLGEIPKRQASQILSDRMRAACEAKAEQPKPVISFKEHAQRWEKDILPLYKFSTRKGHKWILNTHLIPRFGAMMLSAVITSEIQSWISNLFAQEYAAHTIAHFHEVLSSVLNTAVKWGEIPKNPAIEVVLPKLTLKREKWILTPKQAGDLAESLSPKPRMMVVLALTTGMRRGELLALRWRNLDEQNSCLKVNEAVYDNQFDTPKTKAGIRVVPLPDPVLVMLREWKSKIKRTAPEDLVFGTRTGRPAASNNILNRQIAPACEALKLPRATWLTFRRTYSSWSHDKGVPDKVTAALMGHSNVYTTLNVYTQVVDESKKAAAQRIGIELFSIVQFSGLSDGKSGVDSLLNPTQNDGVGVIAGS